MTGPRQRQSLFHGTDMMDFTELAREVLRIEMEGLAAVLESLDARFCAAVECLSRCQGRIVTTGIGKSGLVARKMASTFSSIGASSLFLHPVEAMHGDLGLVRSLDVVLALSNSGETREVLEFVPQCASLGCKTIALVGNFDSVLARMVHYPVPVGVPREACVLNLIPTASTTAAMAVGDAFAACLVRARKVTRDDFHHCHPGGMLGRRLTQKVADVMVTGNLPVARPLQSVAEAMAVLDKGGVGCLVIGGRDGTVEGLVTDGDIRRALVAGRLELDLSVRTIMTPKPLLINQSAYVEDAIDLMEQRSITILPVVDDGCRLVGMLHLHDILGKGSIRFSQSNLGSEHNESL